MFQGRAVEEFHDDVVTVLVFADVVDRADVGMVQGRCGLGFAAEAFEGLGISGDFVGQELEGDEAMKASVLGFVDHAHAAAAEFFEDAVVGDGLADHSWWIIVGRS